jgi:hypothetical protein
MPIAYDDAISEIYGMVNLAVPDMQTILGYFPDVRWPGAPKPARTRMDRVWLRVSTQTVRDAQASLSDIGGIRRYHCVGLLFVEFYGSRVEVDSDGKVIKCCRFMRSNFRRESPSGSIWFRDQKIVPLPFSDENHPYNVVATFEFDDVGGVEHPTSNTGVPLLSGTWHNPNEAIDGVRTVFTFTGLPASQNDYLLVWNGEIQQPPLNQVGIQITMGLAPKIGDAFACYFV